MSFGLTAELLARFQFAFTVSFHFIFPAFSIGLASYLAVLDALWLIGRTTAYLKLFDYWKTVFAVTFGMGVVSGIVMSYQFGTNWAAFSDKAGPVIGPLMGYEVLTAFFLEAGFLGIMLFGRKRVGDGPPLLRRRHGGGRHADLGHLDPRRQQLDADAGGLRDQRRRPVRAGRLVGDHLQPELPLPAGAHGARGLPHHRLRGRRGRRLPPAAATATNRQARIMFSMAMWMAALVTPIQIFAGDQHGLNTLEHQPAKIAAMEGHYETHKGAPLILFGIPDDKAETTHFAIEIPKLGSLILDASTRRRGARASRPSRPTSGRRR